MRTSVTNTGRAESAQRQPSVGRNFVWVLAGNAAYGGCQWAMVVLAAKLGTPEMVGQFALAFALTGPVMVLASLTLREVIATDQLRTRQFGTYLGLRLIVSATAVAVMSAIAASGYDCDTAWTIVFVAVAKALESISDVYFGFMQQHERLDWISRSLVLKGVGSLIGFGAALYVTNSMLWAVAGLALAWGLVLTAYDIPMAGQLAHRVGGSPLMPLWHRKEHISLALTALPLGVALTLGSLLYSIPRYFVERYAGARELGIFAAMGYFVIVGGRIVSALGESASPRLAKYKAERDRASFLRLLRNMLVLSVAIGSLSVGAALVFGRSLLSTFYRTEYAAQAHVFVLLMIAGACSYVADTLRYAMTALGLFRIQPVVMSMACIVATGLSVALVPLYGNTGAAIALLSGFGVHLVGSAYTAWCGVDEI